MNVVLVVLVIVLALYAAILRVGARGISWESKEWRAEMAAKKPTMGSSGISGGGSGERLRAGLAPAYKPGAHPDAGTESFNKIVGGVKRAVKNAFKKRSPSHVAGD